MSSIRFNVFSRHRWVDREETSDTADGNHMLVPAIPAGVSGTALAASLLRDGWSVCHLLLFFLFPFYVLCKKYIFEVVDVCGVTAATVREGCSLFSNYSSVLSFLL